MIKKWFKIKDDIFYPESISCQLTIGSHGTIDISLNIDVYPEYKKYFTDLFDNQFIKSKQSVYKKYLIFEVITPDWKGHGCLIKSMDINPNNGILKLDLNCDYMIQANIQERRDVMIDEILNKTSDSNNNIN